jgi:hypothetical protein
MTQLRVQFGVALAVLLLTTSLSYSQTQATCTFTLFQAPGQVSGVNDFRTTVGQNSSNIQQGFIHYAGGGVSFFSAPNSQSTGFAARNDSGVSVGSYGPNGTTAGKGFILQGSTFTSFSHPKAVWGTALTGINKYNSTVGWYLDSAELAHGFKRYSNGGLASLDFPGASLGTNPAGINDHGTVAGSFGDTIGEHGFIYHGGTWAKIDFPSSGAGTTQVVGISNNNVVVGFNTSNEPYTSFLYANGAFKVISVPNSFSTNVSGISANGVITGNVVYNSGSAGAFTATCK